MSTKKAAAFRLQLGTLSLSLEEIIVLKDISSFTDIEKQLIKFIQEWINPKPYLYQQTSGSTGIPKQIKLYKSQMRASAQSTVDALELKAGDKAFLCIHPNYIGGKMMIVRAIEHQLHLIVGEVMANPLKELKEDIGIDFFSFVPYQLLTILEESADKLSLLNKAKAIILGGAAVSISLQKTINKLIKAPCYSTYGMTETVSHVALKRLNAETVDKAYHAISNVSFSTDENDCLIIHAPHITKVADLTTNDVVRLISPTEFEWLGRNDFVINSGGIKIHAEALEQQISEILYAEGIECSFFIFAKEHDKWGQQVCILVEAKQPIQNLLSLLEQLPKTKRPKQTYYLDRFIYTANDKLNRKETIQKALDSTESN